MSDLTPTLIGAAIVLCGNLVMVAFFSGKHSQRIEALEKDVDDLDAVDKEQWGQINDNSQRISWLEAKTNGQRPH